MDVSTQNERPSTSGIEDWRMMQVIGAVGKLDRFFCVSKPVLFNLKLIFFDMMLRYDRLVQDIGSFLEPVIWAFKIFVWLLTPRYRDARESRT